MRVHGIHDFFFINVYFCTKFMWRANEMERKPASVKGTDAEAEAQGV